MNTEQPTTNPPSFWQRNAVILKLSVIFILVLLLLIPKSMIEGVIRERSYRQNEAISEVGEKWGHPQTLTGPYLSIPYDEVYLDKENKPTKVVRYLHILPKQLETSGNLDPKQLNRGIYDVTVYSSNLEVSGVFELPDLSSLDLDSASIHWNQTKMCMGISDLRGIERELHVMANGKDLLWNPGLPSNGLASEGVSVSLDLKPFFDGKSIDYSIPLQLRGSDHIQFLPLGKTTKTKLTSTWGDPAFDGAFLPVERTVDESGFVGEWEVLHLNRNIPEFFVGTLNNMSSWTYGVRLYIPADGYHQTERAIKYAILFIALTFMIFFFVEIINKLKVHPIQYILIGLALVLFYLLLLSFSEHLNFNASYFISSASTIGLISLYSIAVLKSKQLGMLILGTLTVLYGFVFTLIQMQDFSLLIGSIGLFLILAVMMYFSKSIQWYKVE